MIGKIALLASVTQSFPVKFTPTHRHIEKILGSLRIEMSRIAHIIADRLSREERIVLTSIYARRSDQIASSKILEQLIGLRLVELLPNVGGSERSPKVSDLGRLVADNISNIRN